MKTTPDDRLRLRGYFHGNSPAYTAHDDDVLALLDDFAEMEAELAALRRVEQEGLYVEREAGVDEPRCWYVADGNYDGRADTLSDALIVMDADKKGNDHG